MGNSNRKSRESGVAQRNDKKEGEKMENIKEFFACPSCGRAIAGEKKRFFVCPKCNRALCEESKLADFDDKYCGNCGTNIANARNEALALANKENQSREKRKHVVKSRYLREKHIKVIVEASRREETKMVVEAIRKAVRKRNRNNEEISYEICEITDGE